MFLALWNNRISLLVHLAAVAAGAAVFVCVFGLTAGAAGSAALVPYLAAAAAASLFCLLFASLYIGVTTRHACAATPALAGLVASHVLLALGGYLLFLFALALGAPAGIAVPLSGFLLSGGSFLASRIWVFINPVVQAVEYEELPGDFYQDTTRPEEVGGFRAWYHGGRYAELQSRVLRACKPGDVIYDFGCGGAEWNQTKVPVVGIDVNRSLLEAGRAKGQLSEAVVAELHKTGLPDASADIVIISEVIEHMVDPKAVLAEISRCLKPGGMLILTVPWDTPLSPFFWLFNVQCFYRGYVIGEEYYRQRCGHVNHFSGPRLKRLIAEAGLNVHTLYRFRGFLLYTISSKESSATA